MKTKLFIAIITIAASIAVLSSCQKDAGINYSISKFECTNGSGVTHEKAESLKTQLEMACEVYKDRDVSEAKSYFRTVISSNMQQRQPYSYDITISYSGKESGFLNFKESLL